MLHASYTQYILRFKTPSGTSRGILTEKETFFIRIFDDSNPTILGEGECAVFRGLSIDGVPEYENVLADICWNIEEYKENFREKFNRFPSIICGLEMAFADLKNGGIRQPFPSDFTQRKDFIRINGLIWMGTKENMRQQIIEKIEKGFSCIKLKIGAINFEEELEMLREIRKEFSPKEIELRVDANGAFTSEEALPKLEQLAQLNLHSIEQPIKAGQPEAMSGLCRKSPIPIALDEELIGHFTKEEKRKLLQKITPSYIVLKPSLHGGFCGTQEWIDLARELHTDWWITSALESNIGLNAIAQWAYLQNNPLPQGLGTGQLFLNNVPPEPDLRGDKFYFVSRISRNILPYLRQKFKHRF